MLQKMPVGPSGLVIGLAVFLIFKCILVPAWSSPLNKIPAANILAPFTSLWMTYKRYQGREFETIEAAFQKHGVIVRLGPQELAVNFIDGGIKTVYGRGYQKPSWYNHFILYGHRRRNIISTLDEKHGTVRRRISSVYAKSFLQMSPHFRAAASVVLEKRLIPILWQYHKSANPIEMLELSTAYGVDMLSAVMFGIGCSSNLLRDETAREKFLDCFMDTGPDTNNFWLNDLWDVKCWLAKIGMNPVSRKYYTARARLEEWCLKLIDSTEHVLAMRAPGLDMELGDEPIVYRKLRSAVEEESKRDSISVNRNPLASSDDLRREVASECLDHLIATREDFAITLASIIYMISRHPECQTRLQQELFSVSREGLPTPQALESLPYFNVAIKEALRLRPNPPTPNPRVTPPGQLSTIGPYMDVPPGTRVVAFSRCLHRNERVFPNPTAFIPERWLRPTQVVTEEDKTQMKRVDECEEWFWAFSSGSRMCLASNLAMEMIRMALAAIYGRFSTTVEDDAKFGVGGDFVRGAAGEKLLLKLTAIDNP